VMSNYLILVSFVAVFDVIAIVLHLMFFVYVLSNTVFIVATRFNRPRQRIGSKTTIG